MAKARNTTNVRTRAVSAWKRAMENPDPINNIKFSVRKSRKRETITVSTVDGRFPVTWSYKGGSLRRIAIGA